jgi:hypothetical protein
MGSLAKQESGIFTFHFLLFTFHLIDRFCSGSIAGALNNGFILALLKRLDVIQKEMANE